jgi:diadenosine tetraphosphatase ApaH/serine/threonine PP2A family protein phosphatase
MRVLLLSDIHGNIVALEKVLASAPPHDALWCLGDVVGYGPAPNECCDLLQSRAQLVLLGNHDAAVAGRLPLENFTQLARRALEWTRSAVLPRHVEWLRSHPPRHLMAEHDLELVHASPRDPLEEYITSPYLALENMEFFERAACLYGHTHVPMSFRLDEKDRVLSSVYLQEHSHVRLTAKMLLNPGSIGQPRDGDPRSSFVLLDLANRAFTHYRVEYDVAAVQRAIRNAGLPQRLADRLGFGE